MATEDFVHVTDTYSDEHGTLWQADCDCCGWHTRQAEQEWWVRGVAARHAKTCEFKWPPMAPRGEEAMVPQVRNDLRAVLTYVEHRVTCREGEQVSEDDVAPCTCGLDEAVRAVTRPERRDVDG